ncbi:M23 family metallopeptidase [Streptomyces sp. T-3]|nr:M23 family metallopeptidase [Streptomyces sp. T-3]
MRRAHRHTLLTLLPVLCAVLAVGGLGAPPVVASDGPGISTRVARLYEEASAATQRYEAGRRAADEQHARARKLERLLAKERRELLALHEDLGRIARAQYRTGGDVSYTAQLLMADDPEELMRGQRAAWQADLAMNNMITKTQRAARTLDSDQQQATAAWHALDRRKKQLAGLKRGIELKLDEARWTLEGEAERQVTAGKCRGAVRLEETGRRPRGPWVAPVQPGEYELSAGFGGSGERWAKRHTGQDFAVGIGAPVRAVGAGRVVRVTCGKGFGIEIVVKHAGGKRGEVYYSQYAHLAAVTVDQGDKVRPGQWLGQAGTTGNSTGPHLHFEMRLTPDLGSGVDPKKWLAERGVKL